MTGDNISPFSMNLPSSCRLCLDELMETASQVYLYFRWFIIHHALVNLTSNVVSKYLVKKKTLWCYCFSLIMMFIFNQGDVASYTISNYSRILGSNSQGHTEDLLSKKQHHHWYCTFARGVAVVLWPSFTKGFWLNFKETITQVGWITSRFPCRRTICHWH